MTWAIFVTLHPNFTEVMEKSVPEPAVILNKIRRWCADGEHCSREVIQRLSGWGYPPDQIQDALVSLQKEGYVDDERYARAFVRGKFHNLKWGRLKIAAGLRAQEIDKTLIASAMDEISDEEYLAVVEKEIRKKKASLKNRDLRAQKAALLRFAASRGYEAELVSRILRNDMEEENLNLMDE
jgi:regulatory protein